MTFYRQDDVPVVRSWHLSDLPWRLHELQQIIHSEKCVACSGLRGEAARYFSKWQEQEVIQMTEQGDFRIENGVLLEYKPTQKQTDTVVIPEGVTAIGANAFEECDADQIIFPNSLTSIGNEAFFRCYCVHEIILPDSVTSIGVSAFSECYSLETVKLPSGIKEISADCFYSCYQLTHVAFPETIEKIGDYAFNSCPLRLDRLPSRLRRIGNYAFSSEDPSRYRIKIEEVSFSEAAEEIGEGAFQCCEIKQIVFSPTIKRIAKNTFASCFPFTSVSLSDSVEEIDDYAFYGTCLKYIELPRLLKRIGKYAFANCRNLIHIDFLKSSSSLTVIDDYAFQNCEWLPKALLKSGLIRVGVRAFENCKCLHYVAFPDTLKEIDENAFEGCPLDETILPVSLSNTTQKARVSDVKEYISKEIINYLSDWYIEKIISDLLDRGSSASEGHYSVSIHHGIAYVSLPASDPMTYDPDDMRMNYQFTVREFLEMMEKIRSMQAKERKVKCQTCLLMWKNLRETICKLDEQTANGYIIRVTRTKDGSTVSLDDIDHYLEYNTAIHIEKWRRSPTSSAYQPNDNLKLLYQTLKRKADVLPLGENHYEYSSKGVDIAIRPADGTRIEDGSFSSKTFIQFLDGLAKQKQEQYEKTIQTMNELCNKLEEFTRRT